MGTVKRTEKKVHFKVIMFIASLLFRSKKSVPIDSVLSEKTKIVLVGFEDDRLMKNLDMRGYDNSLLLISGKKKMITAYQDGKKMFQYKSPSQIARNNADVIFLSTKASRHSWRFSHIQHASTIVIELKGLLSLVLVFTGFTLNRLFKRVTFKGFTNGYNEVNKKPMIVIDVLKRKEEQTRKYISPLIGIESFFEELNNHGIRYTILRWFEKLPLIKEGEDIDLLVDNGDAKNLTHLLNEHVGMIPCDTYTVTGINGFDYHSISYFTPTLASDLLNTSIRHKNVYKVPDKEKHFYSLVYHALYHKGYESGLPSTFFPTLYSNPEHDYNKIITELAKNASISVTISMESLHSLLESKGYSPPLDTLYRLSFKNEWIHRLLDKTQNNPIAGKNITVFVLREEAKRNELESRLIKEIENEGFTVLLKKELSEREKDIFSSHTRGGNWGKGPYKHIGGNPATIVVTTDLIPQSVDVYTSIK